MIHFTKPPADALEAPKVVRVQPGAPLKVQLANANYVGTDTHYWGGHTIACKQSGECKACQSGLMPVWAGFIFCTRWNGGRVALLALTPVVAANMTLNADPEKGLLGMKVTLRRKTKAINSNILTSFHGFDPDVVPETQVRLVARVRILFKDYMIEQGLDNDES